MSQVALGGKASPCRTADEPLLGAEAANPADADVGGEAARAVRQEGAVRLEDWWARRSSRAWFDRGGGMDHLETAAEAMTPLLGWDEARRSAEIDNCRAIRARDMAAIRS